MLNISGDKKVYGCPSGIDTLRAFFLLSSTMSF